MGEIQMTEITFEEAAQLLGYSASAVRNAARRGVFTRSPRGKLNKHLLYKEQVGLFEGKEMSIDALSKEEFDKWIAIDNQVSGRFIATAQAHAAVDLMQNALTGNIKISRINRDLDGMLRPLVARASR